MAPPKRLLLTYGDLHISAVPIDEVSAAEAEEIVCKFCAPKSTKLRRLCSVVKHGREYDLVHTVYQCRNCKRQWAVPYKLVHEVRGA